MRSPKADPYWTIIAVTLSLAVCAAAVGVFYAIRRKRAAVQSDAETAKSSAAAGLTIREV
jgi:flagellar basal body-associated protein FliL